MSEGKDTEKQGKQEVIGAFDELFDYPEEEKETLDRAKAFMRYFMKQVERKMEEKELTTEDVSERTGIPTLILEDFFEGEIFLDWLSFYKLKETLEVPVFFFDF